MDHTNGADDQNGYSSNGGMDAAADGASASLSEMPAPSMDQPVASSASGTMPGEAAHGPARGMEPAPRSLDHDPAPPSDPPGDTGPRAVHDDLQQVLVELRPSATRSLDDPRDLAADMAVPGFQVDPSYDPVPIPPVGGAEAGSRDLDGETVIVRGTIAASKIAELEAQPNVVRVYRDTIVMPFAAAVEEDRALVAPMDVAMATCPIGTCDCAPGTAKGTLAEVASYFGVDQIWAAGYRGDGIVVGVVDGGITALGRTPKPGETAKIGRVIGGFPADWGTTAAAWGDHGNMCSTDVLGMAPQAQLYDIRISGGNITATISAALAGFQWAITQHRANGTPHILTNSWGIFQENWDSVYARDPSHIFTRKVVEAINEGILVLFAAGNCGGTCPDGRCGADSGPGRSIWGANGHPRVITVGAVNKNEQFVGYSSQGPAALDPQKPDFCSVTHFKGYFGSDSGTSAATPVAAGVVALLKQANPGLSQDRAKAALKSTAKDIGPAGFDQHSGAGIIRPKLAFDLVHRQWRGWESLGGYCLYDPSVASWAANRLDTFVVGSDSTMYHKWWDGASWSGWESLGGYCASGASSVSWGPNRIDTFVIGLDHALWHKWWDGSSWSGWESLGGYAISAPAAVSWGPNRIDTFVIGLDHALWHKWWDGSSWSGWESLGGYCTEGVAVASWAANRLDTFVIGSDRAMYHKWWDGASWSGWEHLGGVCMSAPAAVSWGPNRIDSCVIGTDRAMWHTWFA
jgi:hypothetical protein